MGCGKRLLLITCTILLGASIASADIWYRDADGDGFGYDDDWIDSPTQPAGYVSLGGDCDDEEITVYPGAMEIPGDGIDQDCDGTELCFCDEDDDMWSISTTVVSFDGDCNDPGEASIITNPQDCNDLVASIHPGATEIPGDGVDQDCDTEELCWCDSDSDGWSIFSTVVSLDLDCTDFGEAPAVTNPEDCNDLDENVYPGAIETWYDAIDQNCDGDNDFDADFDGYVEENSDAFAGGTAPGTGDCRDDDANINPGMAEICDDTVDQDCDGYDAVTAWYYADSDGDGYGDADNSQETCVAPGAGWVLDDNDCDDSDDTVYLGAPEICADGIDNDCDTEIDEDCAVFRILSVADVGNDQGGQVRVKWSRIADDAPGVGDDITGYDVYRRIDAYKAADVPLSEDAKTWPPGDWDFLLQVSASGENEYNVVVPTLCDSTDAGICWSAFFLRARTTSTYVFYDSPVDSGYSIDNLAPAAPAKLAVAYAATAVDLSWEESEDLDFDYFRVYRGATADFDATPEGLVHTTTSTAWSDPVADGWDLHYKVTAVDFAGNESPTAAAERTSGVRAPGVTGRLALHANVPNPFNPSTVIHFELPTARAVRLEIFSLDGRRVATLVDGARDAGLHRVMWDGRGDGGRLVASGTYIYRLDAGGEVISRRMTLLK